MFRLIKREREREKDALAVKMGILMCIEIGTVHIVKLNAVFKSILEIVEHL